VSATDPPKRRGRPPSGGREAILDAALALLAEAGVAKLTSREVAARAGVSDASVYYHFGDRAGLLQAVFARGIKPLEFLEEQPEPRFDIPQLLAASLASLERFYDEVLPVMTAAQSDVGLGRSLAEYVNERDLGPHRGVVILGGYLRSGQAAGWINPTIDPEAVAMMILDVAFARSSRRHMLWRDHEDPRLPSLERLLTAIEQLLEPPRA
jgi:AcrR family transcriptional regulator